VTQCNYLYSIEKLRFSNFENFLHEVYIAFDKEVLFFEEDSRDASPLPYLLFTVHIHDLIGRKGLKEQSMLIGEEVKWADEPAYAVVEEVAVVVQDIDTSPQNISRCQMASGNLLPAL
jgi:hypothetical protein